MLLRRGKSSLNWNMILLTGSIISARIDGGKCNDTKQKASNKEKLQKSGSMLDDLKAGDKIKHEQFGIGTIISVKGEGEDDFASGVCRWALNLLTQYAPITKV